jgi:hypothetical protein
MELLFFKISINAKIRQKNKHGLLHYFLVCVNAMETKLVRLKLCVTAKILFMPCKGKYKLLIKN